MTNPPTTPSAAEPMVLEPCPWCRKPLTVRTSVNPIARCDTPGCWMRERAVTVPLDDPRQVAQWNERCPSAAPRAVTAEMVEAALYSTYDPTACIDGKPVPALTTLLHRICDGQERRFDDAVRLVRLFLEASLAAAPKEPGTVREERVARLSPVEDGRFRMTIREGDYVTDIYEGPLIAVIRRALGLGLELHLPASPQPSPPTGDDDPACALCGCYRSAHAPEDNHCPTPPGWYFTAIAPPTGDVAELIGRLKQRLAMATPGPWELQDGCSWRRIGTRGHDGNVLCPDTYSREDRHPDLTAGKGESLYANLLLIVEAVNALPTLLTALSGTRPSAEAGAVIDDLIAQLDKAEADPPMFGGPITDDDSVTIRIGLLRRLRALKPNKESDDGQ